MGDSEVTRVVETLKRGNTTKVEEKRKQGKGGKQKRQNDAYNDLRRGLRTRLLFQDP